MVNETETKPFETVAKPSTENKSSAFDSGVKAQIEATGSSGTEIYGGYFSEEYLDKLRGARAADEYDKMRRSEAQIAMLLGAVINPIKSATWEFESFEPGNEVFDKQTEFVRFNLMEGLSNGWENFLHEALTFIPFGFAVFETVHNVIFNHPKFGTFNGLHSLGFRSQKTIYQWKLEKKTGKLLGVTQWSNGDVGSRVDLDGQFLIVFTNNKEGDNYEGISALRPMYGAFIRKQLYLKLVAIGVEKYALGTPVGTTPANLGSKSKEFEEFKSILKRYAGNESAYIIKPSGYEIEIVRGDFDASKVKDIIVFENTEMINALVANFLALGTNGGGGSYSLGSDLSDFFFACIQSFANVITGGLNRKIIPDLVKLNFGQQPGYPKLKCTGINDKAGKELAEVVNQLIGAGALKGDMKLEEFLRKSYKLPAMDPTTQSQYEKKTPQVIPGAQFSEQVKLADSYRKDFKINKEAIAGVMRANLTGMLSSLKSKIGSAYKNAKGSDKIKAALGVSVSGTGEYNTALKKALAKSAFLAIENARKEVPAKRSYKFSEPAKLAGEYNYLDSLPPKVRKLVEAQARAVVDTQAADLEKIVTFQFTSSATTTDDFDLMWKDVEGRAVPVINGEKAAGMNVDVAASDALAQVTQSARNAFFFEPEVLDEIESFTFENEDPISDICQNLAGQTFAANDTEAERYFPPLHHNCKSRIVPNLKGAKGNPDIGSLGILAKDKEERTRLEGQITFSECCHGKHLFE